LNESEWTNEFPASILVCDLRGIVLEMNSKASEMYRSFGGMDLIGKCLIDCHPEPARSKLLRLLETGETNVYTVEKNGVRKLIYQSPWHRNGSREGMIEFAIEIPAEVPHFVRK
jgi:hypothetical protein